MIDLKNITIETYRSARIPGGQHCGVGERFVKATHIPTGITVEVDEFRSQHQNREKALKDLNIVVTKNWFEEDKSLSINELIDKYSMDITDDNLLTLEEFSTKYGNSRDNEWVKLGSYKVPSYYISDYSKYLTEEE